MPASVLYSGKDFPGRSVLVRGSVYETIYRLEEAYWGLRTLTKTEARKTFAWLRSRIAAGTEDILRRTEYDRLATGGYRDKKTGKYVRVTYLKSLTGEPGGKHPFMLLCSVLRMAELAPDLARTLKDHFMVNEPGPKGRRPHMIEAGMYCCQVCTPQYERALRLAAPGLYRRQEAKFIANLKAWRERGGGTRWYRAPFYLTVLALHDIASKAAREELQCVAARVSPRLPAKWSGDDRASRAKAKAAEILLSYRR